MPDEHIGKSHIDHLLEITDKQVNALGALFEGIPSRVVENEELRFLRDMARGVIGNAVKSFVLADTIITQARIEATPITMSNVYQEVLMPAPRVDFPDENGKTVSILVRHGKELRGSGVIKVLSPEERAILSFLLQHQGPLSRRAFETFGFREDLDDSARKAAFSKHKNYLSSKIWRLKGCKEGLLRGPNDGEFHSLCLSGVSFICGLGTRTVSRDRFISSFPPYQPSFKMAPEPVPAQPKSYPNSSASDSDNNAPSWAEIKQQWKKRIERDRNLRHRDLR